MHAERQRVDAEAGGRAGEREEIDLHTGSMLAEPRIGADARDHALGFHTLMR